MIHLHKGVSKGIHFLTSIAGKMSERAEGEKSGRDQSTFKKVNEVRKKIALVEGKRRALFSSVEREKKSNREQTSKLDEDLLVKFKYI